MGGAGEVDDLGEGAADVDGDVGDGFDVVGEVDASGVAGLGSARADASAKREGRRGRGAGSASREREAVSASRSRRRAAARRWAVRQSTSGEGEMVWDSNSTSQGVIRRLGTARA